MKKLLFGMVAIVCCLAFVGPAVAKVTMGGMIDMDAYWTKDSKEQAAARAGNPIFNGADTNYKSEDYTYINMNRALTRFDMRYESDDKLILAMIEIRYGLENSRSAANIVDFYYGWIDYRPGGEKLHFRFGAQPETFAIMAPGAANIGYDTTSTLFVGFGNLHASSVTSAKAYVRFTDMIRMEFMVGDPTSGPATANDAFVPAQEAQNGALAQTGVQERGTIPRFDLSFPISVGKFTIEPSGTWLRRSYDYVVGTADDNFDIWGASLGAKAGFGPFTILGEVTYGQNLANGNYTGAGNKPPIVGLGPRFQATARLDSNGNFSDTTFLGWWIQAEFDFGPFAIQGAYGQEKDKNDDIATFGGSTGEILDTTRRAAALRFPIKVAKGFEIAPNVQYLDFDDSATSYGRSYDLGTTWVAGVQFNLVF